MSRRWVAPRCRGATLAAFITAVSAACGSSASETASSSNDTTATTSAGSSCEPVFASVQAEVFLPACSVPTCHGAEQAAAALSLEGDEPAVLAQLVGTPDATCQSAWQRVVPGNPDESLLVVKLGDVVPCGVPMPVGNRLSEDDVACIRTWIEELDAAQCERCGGDTCLDLERDPENCGICGRACPQGVTCFDATCACPEPLVACDGACVDPRSDPEHCGDCGRGCGPEAPFCRTGECSSDCGALTQCDASCVDTTSDLLHCGDCDRPCPVGTTCDNGTCACTGGPASYAQDIEPVFVAECTAMGCHTGPAPKAGLDLRDGAGYDNLVGVASAQCGDRALVAPGEPSQSYLLDKLLGTNLCFGTQMPKSNQSLAPDELDAVSRWICAGAAP